MVTYSIACPHCQQTEHVIKSGKSEAKTQRYLCKDCNKTFATDSIIRRITPEKEELIMAHMIDRTSIRGICRAINFTPNTIIKRSKKTEELPELEETLLPT